MSENGGGGGGAEGGYKNWTDASSETGDLKDGHEEDEREGIGDEEECGHEQSVW